MEIVIDPAQLWHQFISFANDYKLLTSLVLLIVLHFIKKGVLRLIRRISSHRGEDRR
ncbi:MAG TPA: mechanosensitive ion channel protein MscS, partial [Alteromonas macleodii]|nr:mechanosensitive ion channel protein MscS [Alteromonas macleodii]